MKGNTNSLKAYLPSSYNPIHGVPEYALQYVDESGNEVDFSIEHKRHILEAFKNSFSPQEYEYVLMEADLIFE